MPPTVRADTAPPPPPISIGTVYGSFYNNSSYGNGTFDVTSGATPVFTQIFPTIDFNPPVDANVQQHCSTPTGVDENSRPFTDVDPNPDGSCTNIVAQDNGLQAGVATLTAFEAAFTSTLTVAAPGQVTFNLYSDDGWVLAAGADAAGDQPAYLSGSCAGATCTGNSPAPSQIMGYPIVGAYNQLSSPAQNTVTVNFPAAGTYPIELDYTEGDGGQLALVLGTSYANPILPQNPQAGVPTATPPAPHTDTPTPTRTPTDTPEPTDTVTPTPQRVVVFVHGINGDARAIENQASNQGDDTDYTSLYPAVKQRYRGVRLKIVECVGDACDGGRRADHGHCGARARAAERHIRGRHPTAVGARLPCDRRRRLHPTIIRCTRYRVFNYYYYQDRGYRISPSTPPAMHL